MFVIFQNENAQKRPRVHMAQDKFLILACTSWKGALGGWNTMVLFTILIKFLSQETESQEVVEETSKDGRTGRSKMSSLSPEIQSLHLHYVYLIALNSDSPLGDWDWGSIFSKTLLPSRVPE